MPNVEIEICICHGCNSYDWSEEEIVHLKQQCRGRHDEQLIERVPLVRKVPPALELVAA
jgi:hypothetical protein